MMRLSWNLTAGNRRIKGGVVMITETARRLNEIDYEIGESWLAFHTGQISLSQANEKMQKLEDEKERLWAKAKE